MFRDTVSRIPLDSHEIRWSISKTEIISFSESPKSKNVRLVLSVEDLVPAVRHSWSFSFARQELVTDRARAVLRRPGDYIDDHLDLSLYVFY